MTWGAISFRSLQHLADDRDLHRGKAADVAAGMRKASHITSCDRIGATRNDDRNRVRLCHQDGDDASPYSRNEIWIEVDKIRRRRADQVHIVAGPALLELNIDPGRPASFAQFLTKYAAPVPALPCCLTEMAPECRCAANARVAARALQMAAKRRHSPRPREIRVAAWRPQVETQDRIGSTGCAEEAYGDSDLVIGANSKP